MDVSTMLTIPQNMQMGLGDVSMFIETEKIQLEEPYSYEYNRHSQSTQSSYEQDYGNGHLVDFGDSIWVPDYLNRPQLECLIVATSTKIIVWPPSCFEIERMTACPIILFVTWLDRLRVPIILIHMVPSIEYFQPR